MAYGTIAFKSREPYFTAEKIGDKRNTVRFTDDWPETTWDNYLTAIIVKIINPITGYSFLRTIKHKCKYKNLVIISW